MKWLFPLLLLASSALADDFLGSRVSTFKESSYDFRLSRAAVASAPLWKADADQPPLPARKALEIALKQARQLRPEVTDWGIADIRLEPVGGSSSAKYANERWITMVRLQDFSGPIAGVPWQLDIPVYMDGSTVTPLIKKLKR